MINPKSGTRWTYPTRSDAELGIFVATYTIDPQVHAVKSRTPANLKTESTNNLLQVYSYELYIP
jgi:hypothetical protein